MEAQMKNQHSYYLLKLLKCISINKMDNHPTLLIGDSIRLLQEYANDANSLIDKNARRLAENVMRYVDDKDLHLEASRLLDELNKAGH